MSFVESGFDIEFLAPSFIWSQNINKANFENELLLTEIVMLVATSKKQTRFVPQLKQNHRIGAFFAMLLLPYFFL